MYYLWFKETSEKRYLSNMNTFGGLLLILMEDHQNDKIITATILFAESMKGSIIRHVKIEPLPQESFLSIMILQGRRSGILITLPPAYHYQEYY